MKLQYSTAKYNKLTSQVINSVTGAPWLWYYITVNIQQDDRDVVGLAEQRWLNDEMTQ